MEQHHVLLLRIGNHSAQPPKHLIPLLLGPVSAVMIKAEHPDIPCIQLFCNLHHSLELPEMDFKIILQHHLADGGSYRRHPDPLSLHLVTKLLHLPVAQIRNVPAIDPPRFKIMDVQLFQHTELGVHIACNLIRKSADFCISHTFTSLLKSRNRPKYRLRILIIFFSFIIIHLFHK